MMSVFDMEKSGDKINVDGKTIEVKWTIKIQHVGTYMPDDMDEPFEARYIWNGSFEKVIDIIVEECYCEFISGNEIYSGIIEPSIYVDSNEFKGIGPLNGIEKGTNQKNKPKTLK